MPNWCSNLVRIVGAPADVDAVIAHVDARTSEPSEEHPHGHPDETSFSLHRIAPLSEAAREEMFGAVNEWGTKWDVRARVPAITALRDGRKAATWEFDSAWSPPSEALEALAASYPTVELTLYAEELGNGLCSWAYWPATTSTTSAAGPAPSASTGSTGASTGASSAAGGTGAPAPSPNVAAVLAAITGAAAPTPSSIPRRAPGIDLDLTLVHPSGLPLSVRLVDLRDPALTDDTATKSPAALLRAIRADGSDHLGESGALLYGPPSAVTRWLRALDTEYLTVVDVPAATTRAAGWGEDLDVVWVCPTPRIVADIVASSDDALDQAHGDRCYGTWDDDWFVQALLRSLREEVARIPARSGAGQRRLLTAAVSLATRTRPDHPSNARLARALLRTGEPATHLALLLSLLTLTGQDDRVPGAAADAVEVVEASPREPETEEALGSGELPDSHDQQDGQDPHAALRELLLSATSEPDLDR